MPTPSPSITVTSPRQFAHFIRQDDVTFFMVNVTDLLHYDPPCPDAELILLEPDPPSISMTPISTSHPPPSVESTPPSRSDADAEELARYTADLEPAVRDLIREYHDVFPSSFSYAGIPPMRDVEHSIQLVSDYRAHHQAPYRLSIPEATELKRQLEELLRLGFIKPNNSPWGAPVLFARKADGTLCLCIDYRGLNRYTVKNSYPMPRSDELFDRLAGNRFFTKIDLRSGYHQIRVATADQPITLRPLRVYGDAIRRHQRTRYLPEGDERHLQGHPGADTGPGVRLDAYRRIFRPFGESSQSPLKSDGQNMTKSNALAGLGLGLAICKGVVTLMGGQIGFKSLQGVGTVMYCLIPLRNMLPMPNPLKSEGNSEQKADVAGGPNSIEQGKTKDDTLQGGAPAVERAGQGAPTEPIMSTVPAQNNGSGDPQGSGTTSEVDARHSDRRSSFKRASLSLKPTVEGEMGSADAQANIPAPSGMTIGAILAVSTEKLRGERFFLVDTNVVRQQIVAGLLRGLGVHAVMVQRIEDAIEKLVEESMAQKSKPVSLEDVQLSESLATDSQSGRGAGNLQRGMEVKDVVTRDTVIVMVDGELVSEAETSSFGSRGSPNWKELMISDIANRLGSEEATTLTLHLIALCRSKSQDEKARSLGFDKVIAKPLVSKTILSCFAAIADSKKAKEVRSSMVSSGQTISLPSSGGTPGAEAPPVPLAAVRPDIPQAAQELNGKLILVVCVVGLPPDSIHTQENYRHADIITFHEE
ncbi:hypothetical protein CBR_g45920 [Chara braunii]|uniref:Histidine kinase domain-containing protein n=1 Tax=Chara braunii TaxID=69332 RepID=A0A388LZS1_CHABU|nr:hypothetical protein CBR_g45920 [Chara braunii]|eukprot:GBG87765.1 hypothetical protein CBR_g45920 [Chara braunii]